MKDLINGAFEVLSVLFNKIPVLNKLQGYRTVLGFVGLAVCAFFKIQGIGDQTTVQALEYGFMGLTALSLNAKGRSE